MERGATAPLLPPPSPGSALVPVDSMNVPGKSLPAMYRRFSLVSSLSLHKVQRLFNASDSWDHVIFSGTSNGLRSFSISEKNISLIKTVVIFLYAVQVQQRSQRYIAIFVCLSCLYGLLLLLEVRIFRWLSSYR